MIIRGSRYEQASLVKVQQADGTYTYAVYTTRQTEAVAVTYTQLVIVGGERLDTIAHQVYGDASLWWVLARANPEIIYPDDVLPGTVLRIPNATLTTH